MPRYLTPHAPLPTTPCPAVYHPMPRHLPPHAPLSTTPGEYEYRFALQPLHSTSHAREIGPSRMRVRFVIEMTLSEAELISEPEISVPVTTTVTTTTIAPRSLPPLSLSPRPRSAQLGGNTLERAEQATASITEAVTICYGGCHHM